jgi:predicted acylesterase/phospholipase RssA
MRRSFSTKTNSFAMSGSGWLMPFFIGAVDALKQRGIMNSSSIYAGTSGGSICALMACADFSAEMSIEMIIRMSKDPKVWTNLDGALRNSLNDLLTESMTDQCQNRLFVTTTKVLPIVASVLSFLMHQQ